MPRPNWQLLPDPQTAGAELLDLSVDDHLTEPADMFVSRFPASCATRRRG